MLIDKYTGLLRRLASAILFFGKQACSILPIIQFWCKRSVEKLCVAVYNVYTVSGFIATCQSGEKIYWNIRRPNTWTPFLDAFQVVNLTC